MNDPQPNDSYDDERYAAGMAVRREVLGDAHVDRAEANKTPFNTDFQAYITRCAWGEVWTRPGLDRRTRSVITLTALIAGGHWEELQMHLRAAKRNGLSEPEIGEVILQTAVYLGVPAANHAFAIAVATFAEDTGAEDTGPEESGPDTSRGDQPDPEALDSLTDQNTTTEPPGNPSGTPARPEGI